MWTAKIELDALTSAPVYENHRRGKNWFARIVKDPASPGGLGRSFQRKAHGEYFYFVNDLKVGDVVEFGADYYSAGGNPSRTRFYGVIRSLSDTEIQIEEYETAAKAFNAQKEAAG